MILLDTHAWVWWVHGDARLSEVHREMLDARTIEGIELSASANPWVEKDTITRLSPETLFHYK